MVPATKESEAGFRLPLLALKRFAVLLAVALGSVTVTVWRIAGRFEIEFTDYLRWLDGGRLEGVAGAVANEQAISITCNGVDGAIFRNG